MSTNHPNCWIASITPIKEDPDSDMREAKLSLQRHEEFLTLYADRREITDRAMLIVRTFNARSPFTSMLIERQEILELLKEAVKANG